MDRKSSIILLILDRIKERLQDYMVDQVPLNDPMRIDVVKVGRFQENPNIAAHRIAVMTGDLDDPNYLDGIVSRINTNQHRIAFFVEPREIGGGEMWYRKGTVRLELFFIQDSYDEDTAREIAYAILARAEQCLMTTQVGDLQDDQGENAVQLFAPANTMMQSGGPPNSYIFRGKIQWQVLTERESIDNS